MKISFYGLFTFFRHVILWLWICWKFSFFYFSNDVLWHWCLCVKYWVQGYVTLSHVGTNEIHLNRNRLLHSIARLFAFANYAIGANGTTGDDEVGHNPHILSYAAEGTIRFNDAEENDAKCNLCDAIRLEWSTGIITKAILCFIGRSISQFTKPTFKSIVLLRIPLIFIANRTFNYNYMVYVEQLCITGETKRHLFNPNVAVLVLRTSCHFLVFIEWILIDRFQTLELCCPFLASETIV